MVHSWAHKSTELYGRELLHDYFSTEPFKNSFENGSGKIG